MDASCQLAVVKNQKGMTLVLMASLILILCGMLGLALDLGHMQAVRGELQNCADAAALAGAGSLLPPAATAVDWDGAARLARDFIRENKSDNANNPNLADGTVEVGYWNPANWNYYSSPDLKARTTPVSSLISGDIPAVKVTISRSAGSNGGPVDTFFLRVFGVDSWPVSSKPAVAAVGPASTMTGDVFPVAISKSFADATPLVNGQSSQFNMTPDTGTASKWTTLKEGNGAKVSRDLTDPTYVLKNPISVGMTIDNSSGDKTSIYNSIDSHKGSVVFFPVVSNFSDNTVVGFIAFHILSAKGGSSKFIQGYFVGPIKTNLGKGSAGANFGTYALPGLVN